MGKAKPNHAPNAAAEVPQIVRRAVDAIESEGAVKVSTLGAKSMRAQAIAELANLGFEVTAKFVRKPIAAQLQAALAHGAFIPLKQVAAHALGAAGPEAKSAALRLVADGTARLVLRGTEEVLVPSSAPVLTRQELTAFHAISKIVAKIAKSKSGASLLHSDLAQAIERALPSAYSAFTPGAARKNAPPEKPRVNAAVSRLLSAVDATRNAQTGLSFVPAVVARMRPELSAEAANAALLDAAKSGLLELRPEGGINRLSADELALCPPGPQGTRLSWARRTENVAR